MKNLNEIAKLLNDVVDNVIKAAGLLTADDLKLKTCKIVELLKSKEVPEHQINSFCGVYRAYKQALSEGRTIEQLRKIAPADLKKIGKAIADGECVNAAVWDAAISGKKGSDLQKLYDAEGVEKAEAKKAETKAEKAKKAYVESLPPLQRALHLMGELKLLMAKAGVDAEFVVKTQFPELFKASNAQRVAQLVGQQQ